MEICLSAKEAVPPSSILGFVETTAPTLLRRELSELHRQIKQDKYLEGIPSLNKTNVAFHAKNDVPEVRQAVYKCIARMDFKAQFVVARKVERVFRHSFHASEHDFYDYLVSLLFENVLRANCRNHIYFSQRGTRSRQAQLEQAIRRGMDKFEVQWNRSAQPEIRVLPHTPVGEPCLQVIDYMNWAVQRAFVRQEMRYYRFVEDKVSLLVDRYDLAKYPKNWYGKENPFDIKKASPL